MYYIIENMLRECSREECLAAGARGKQYVAVLTPQEWQSGRDSFEMGIDMDLDVVEIHNTKAEVNYDSLTGSFSIPNMNDLSADYGKFAFALDERGVVFIDPGDGASGIIKKIQGSKKWRIPSLERFLFDFLEQIVSDDTSILEKYEKELDGMDERLNQGVDFELERLNEIRCDLRDIRTHYDRLIDLVQELEENENNFFKSEDIRYFKLFSNRVSRLFDTVTSLREYTAQIRDTYHSKLDVKQNRIMTVLTVVTTIFMPLTLITGWYGMNFRYMPELDSPWGYPIVILVSLIIAVGCLIFFKKKKWL